MTATDRMTCGEALDLAKRWANKGFHAFPIAIGWEDKKQATNKRPLTVNGHHDATTDPATLERLFNAKSPRPGEVWGVGLWPGPSGYLVLDPDTKNGERGDDELAALEAEHGKLDTLRAVTASGGGHVYLKKPADVHVGNADLAPGVNVRADDGWVVAISTRTPWGSWDHDEATPRAAIDCPRWLLDRLGSTNGHGGGKGHWTPLDRSKLHPADLACLEAAERLGGHDAYIGGDGYIMIVSPHKTAGGSASIGHIGPGVMKIFTDGWPGLEQNSRYDADELNAIADRLENPKPAGTAPQTVDLDECITVFRKWLHLPDPRIVTAALAGAAANLIPGDPCWLLLVGPPSSAKTETLSPFIDLPYVHAAATVSPAALLSGTPPKERAKGAKGGLLRQVRDFGILLCKDFTSVLSMHRDARAEALAALREIYDGMWARPVGAAGGSVLEWSGKCGLLGGCTPSIDRHHAVMGALGERFLLYRVDVDDPGAQARKRLSNRRHETEIRAELGRAVAGLLAGIDQHTPVPDTDPAEDTWIVDLAVFTAKARTPVERDGYDRSVVVMPSSEGPARIAAQLGAMRDGLAVIGAILEDRHAILHKLAWDAMPVIRRKVLEAIRDSGGWLTRAQVMDRTEVPSTSADRELEDLVLIGMIERAKAGAASNSPWHYSLRQDAHEMWPTSSPEMSGTPCSPSDPASDEAFKHPDHGLEDISGEHLDGDPFDYARAQNPGELGPLEDPL